ncbi:MAG TPA: carboxypeptidase regulatory-like domain-containing protein [Terriglobales bacterium]|nr:carboxypeptidase regulatory-like domain-containing protein [Terriglobales bacterium]
MNRKLLVVISLLAAVLLSYRPAWSQTETGSINGTVTDSTGAVIPGASVTAKSVATGAERPVKTGSSGEYLIQGLLPGFYDVTATSGNFSPFTTRVEVTVGGKATVDAQLSVSGKTTTVEVVGAGGAVVNTQSQELSQLVDTTQLAQLPSLNRDPYAFVALSGNVSNADTTSNAGSPNPSFTTGQSLTDRGVGYSINGQRESGTEILLDGVENVGIFTVVAGQTVPVDSIQEFSIITNNFGAEYGRASGGIVNVDTKSGTNEIHGSAFEYNRLSAYTANTFNDEINDIPKGTYVRNQFGYNIGGPIIKNKLFANFSEEFVRVRSDAAVQNDILDPTFISMLPGNVQSYFSTFGTGALPSSGTPVTAGDLVAAGTFGGSGFPLIDGITAVPDSTPVFDHVFFRAPFDAGGGVPQNTYDLVGRLDYNLTNETTMFFRFARYSENDFPGAVNYSAYPQYDSGGTNFDNSALLSLSHTFSSNLLSSTKLSFTRFNVATSYDTKLTNTPNLYMSTNNYAQATDPAGQGFVIQLPGLENTADGSGGLPYGGPQNTIQVLQDVAWTKGKHSMRFGGELTYIQLNVAYGAYQQANEVLGSDVGPSLSSLVDAGGVQSGGEYVAPLLQFQARVNAEGQLPCATDIFGNSIVTPACTVAPPLPAADPARSYRYHDWALYAQDSFKITRKLTLNYALRYEHFGVQHNNHQGLDSNFYYGAGTYPEDVRNGGVEFTTKSSVGQFWQPNWGTLAPRIGFAYDVFGDGKTALRGGFGISYERNFGNVTYNASFNPPASAVLSSICTADANGVIGSSCTQSVTNNDLGPLGQPGPATALTPTELRMPDPRINTAQTQFWSLAIERELAPSTLLRISYSGAHGVHLYDINNINLLGAGQALLGDPLVVDPACPYSNPLTGDPTCYTRPNSQYAAINDRGSNGSSAYDALDVSFQTNNLHHTGLNLVANYTWAHSLDDLSSTFSESETAASLGYTDYQNPRLDWGSADYDIRHRVVISPVWNTPWYKEGRGVLRQVLGGWTVSGIFTARTGIPFSVFDLGYLLNYYVIPRLTPATPITQYRTGTPVLQPDSGNTFFALNIPAEADIGPLNPALGISDFGPYPANMTRRNAFRGPGAWNTDFAIGKNFKLTERFALDFRAEAFNIFNHHNFYVNGEDNYDPSNIVEEKGGLGSGALGGDHDERRFGQFSLRLSF